MKRAISTAGLFFVTLMLSLFTLLSVASAQGCGGMMGGGMSGGSTHGSGHNGHDASSSSDEVSFAPIVEGVQTVTVVVTASGYKPERIRLHAGVPARVLFDQRASGACPSQVQMPSLGVKRTDLPNGVVTAISFTPEKSGTYQYTCGMNMLKGTIIVGE